MANQPSPPPETKAPPKLVTVRCFVPNGLHLRLFDMVDGPPSGSDKVAASRMADVVLNGDGALRFGDAPSLAPGMGLTAGVDAAYLAEWAAQCTGDERTLGMGRLVEVVTS